MLKIQNINDLTEVLDKLNQTPEPSKVSLYDNDENGKLIYNPLSREAAKTWQINKSNTADTNSWSLSIDGIAFDYIIPKNVTANNVIPIRYTTGDYCTGNLLYIEATAYGKEKRGRGNITI